MTDTESHVDTQGASPPDAIGLRNQTRARWRALPQVQRDAIVLAVEALVAIALFFVDNSLGVGFAIVCALFWLRRLEPLPWRLLAELGILAVCVALAASGHTRWSLPIALALGMAYFWIGEIPRVPRLVTRWSLIVAALVATILYPFYLDRMFTLPVFGAFPDVSTGVVMLVFVMMAVGLNIVVGYAGLLDLGYVAFYATGAYTAAWFASLQFPKRHFDLGAIGLFPGHTGIHVSLWILIPLAGVVTAFFGIVIGLPTLRLRGDYLAIVTLGFGEILPQIARNGDNFFGTGFNLTNGPNGITPLDSPGFGNGISHATGGFLPANYLTCCKAHYLGHQIASTDVYFWTAIVLLCFTVFCSARLQFSRLGRAWIAIREDETAAAAMGVPLMRTKTWAYASGAFFGGIAGAYYAAFKSATFPGDFFFNISVFILCMVILGGMGNIWGVIVGAAFLAYLDRAGLANAGDWINTHIHVGSHHPHLDVSLYASGIYGVIILLVMLFRPAGMIPSRRRAAEFEEGVHDEPLYDATGA